VSGRQAEIGVIFRVAGLHQFQGVQLRPLELIQAIYNWLEKRQLTPADANPSKHTVWCSAPPRTPLAEAVGGLLGRRIRGRWRVPRLSETSFPKLLEFLRRIGVALQAGPPDYAKAIREMAADGCVDKVTRDRIHKICRRLAQRWAEGGNWLENPRLVERLEPLHSGGNWLGTTNGNYGFHGRGETGEGRQ